MTLKQTGASAPSSIVAALQSRAARQPGRRAFSVVELDGAEQTLSYAELLERARCIAGGLRERGLHRGDRVLVCLPQSPELLLVVYGVLLAGGVCVPTYPPQSHQLRRWKEQVLAMARLTQPWGAVVPGLARLHMASLLERVGDDLYTVTPAQLESAPAASAVEAEAADLALVQFTSGTTRRPRGVAVSHAALMANLTGLLQVMPLCEQDVSVSWLPPYHDMGLIGHLFVPVLAGVHQLLLPATVMQRHPERWLQLCSTVRATQTTAPNFAFARCASHLGAAQRRGLDLGSLRWVLNGSEMVLPETLAAFSTSFAPCGFRPDAFRPVYGLAEATLTATFSREGGARVDRVERAGLASRGQARPVRPGETAAAQGFVSLGTPLPGHELRVMGEAGPCPPRQVGEVCLRGPSVMAGYFNDPGATLEVLRDGWLHTGDLGYLDEAGRLHVTGRRKDLIIKNGRNLLPDDVEAALQGLPALRPGRAVAFGLPSAQRGTEELVVVAEVHEAGRARDPVLLRRVAQAVVERTGVSPDRVELCRAGRLPKTTSGKLQRGQVRALFEAGRSLQAPARAPGQGLLETARSAMELASTRLARILGWQ